LERCPCPFFSSHIDHGQVLSPFQAILDYELSKNIPPGWVNYSISKTKPNGFWHRLERGEILLDKDWFAGFTTDLHDQKRWTDFYAAARSKNPSLPKTTPPLPEVDGEYLFWEMMRGSRDADPWMFPALKKLKESGKYILAALSNTLIFPPGHPYNNTHSDVKSVFDVFVSSAHVGMRKPNADIYQYTLEQLNRWAKLNAWTGRGYEDGVKPNEIVFLDDIGENLKAGKEAGFGTIKVHLGRAYEAVDALEELTGLQLAGDHPRIAIKPKL
jgi:FMN phosphatase YigB (HAD superfamily)